MRKWDYDKPDLLIDVYITDTRTGETRLHKDCAWWEEDQNGIPIVGQWNDYQWTEGNYGCDCNRQLFFWRAGNDDKDINDEHECGEYKFRIKVIWHDTEVVLMDESKKTDEPVVDQSVDVVYSTTKSVTPPVRQVWNLDLLRDFISRCSGNLHIFPAAQGHANDTVRPRTYKLSVLFHDIEVKERVCEIFIDRDGNA